MLPQAEQTKSPSSASSSGFDSGDACCCAHASTSVASKSIKRNWLCSELDGADAAGGVRAGWAALRWNWRAYRSNRGPRAGHCICWAAQASTLSRGVPLPHLAQHEKHSTGKRSAPGLRRLSIQQNTTAIIRRKPARSKRNHNSARSSQRAPMVGGVLRSPSSL